MKLDKAAKEGYLSKLSVPENNDPYFLKGEDFTGDLAALLKVKYLYCYMEVSYLFV